MENSETVLKSDIRDTLLNNTEYYKYIFKKTEKIVCAVFYVIRSSGGNVQDAVLKDLEDTAQSVLINVLESLETRTKDTRKVAERTLFDLIGLDARLRLAHAAQHIGEDTLMVFLHEIDSVERIVRRFAEDKVSFDFKETPALPPKEKRTPKREVSESLDVSGSSREESRSRTERILEVIRDKEEASIKDIVEHIKDCSEKTIQRELNNLIRDNIVHREGERRWSKYSM